MTHANIRTALLCDDVRIENNGKYIIIGAYPLNIISIQNLQLQVTFACYVEMQTEMRNYAVGMSRIMNNAGYTLFSEPFRLALRPNGLNYMFFEKIHFVPTYAGEFKFQWQFGTGEWTDIATVMIEDASVQSAN